MEVHRGAMQRSFETFFVENPGIWAGKLGTLGIFLGHVGQTFKNVCLPQYLEFGTTGNCGGGYFETLDFTKINGT